MVRRSRERGWFLGIAGAAVVGTGIELAAERHWKGGTQIIPWISLGALAIALVMSLRSTPRMNRLVTALAALVGISGLIGIYEHVAENRNAGPLDYRYTDRWPTMSSAEQWWAAISKSVGPSPPLAPAVLALAALCLVLSLDPGAPEQPTFSM